MYFVDKMTGTINLKSSDSLISVWLNDSKLLESSKRQYKSQVTLFFNTYDELNISNIVRFLNQGQGTKRCYHRKSAIKSFLRHLKNAQILSLSDFQTYTNEIDTISYNVKERREIETLLYDELLVLLDSVEDTELALILMIAFDTASRIRAILKLRRTDVKVVDDECKLFLREKGEKSVEKIITDETYTHLLKYLNKSTEKYIFMQTNKINEDKLETKYRDLLKKLKKYSKRALGKEISFHWIRRGAGVYWYRKKKDIVFVQHLLNHKSPDITAKYLRLQGLDVQEAIKKERRPW